jgi:hypothetical protein
MNTGGVLVVTSNERWGCRWVFRRLDGSTTGEGGRERESVRSSGYFRKWHEETKLWEKKPLPHVERTLPTLIEPPT